MGIMWIVLTFHGLSCLSGFPPFLLCKMIKYLLLLDLKTILLLRAPSHTGGHCLPNWSQGHITLFLFVENHSAWLWEEEVCIFIYLTTEHCFVFMREQWGVPQTKLASWMKHLLHVSQLLSGLAVTSPPWWLRPCGPLPRWSRADLSDRCNTVSVMCDFCLVFQGSSSWSQPPRCADPGSSGRSLHGGAEASFNSSSTLWWATLGMDLPVTAKPPADCSSDWPLTATSWERLWARSAS